MKYSAYMIVLGLTSKTDWEKCECKMKDLMQYDAKWFWS